uniref:Uncharacterized protein n=1 Tax=Arundo donax TaxID=35708 RepID=A0A0A9E5S0_ARUDO
MLSDCSWYSPFIHSFKGMHGHWYRLILNTRSGQRTIQNKKTPNI